MIVSNTFHIQLVCHEKYLCHHFLHINAKRYKSRMAKVYSIMNQPSASTDWLIKATASAYNALYDLDSLEAFKNLRSASNFKEIRLKVYEMAYPFSREPRTHDFDFWIGDWNCYRSGTQILSGTSHVEAMERLNLSLAI